MIEDLRNTLGQIMFEVLWESGSLIHQSQIVAEVLAITAAEEK
jgi:hypothetical protein